MVAMQTEHTNAPSESSKKPAAERACERVGRLRHSQGLRGAPLAAGRRPYRRNARWQSRAKGRAAI